jgi:hypothetical protein
MTKQEAIDKMNEQLEHIPKAEIRLLNLAVLPRLTGALNDKSDSCRECAELHDTCVEFVNDIVQVLRGTQQQREEFESFVSNAFMHLQHDHDTLPKGRLLSVSVLTGMLLGTGFALLLNYFFMGRDIIGYGVLGWVIGVVAGYGAGKLRENKLKKDNRLF